VGASVRPRAGQPGPPTIASAPGGSNRPPGCRGILFRGFRVVSEAWRQTCEESCCCRGRGGLGGRRCALSVGAALLPFWSEGPRDPASAATEAAASSLVYTASLSGVDEAARELDLIRPPTPQQASAFIAPRLR